MVLVVAYCHIRQVSGVLQLSTMRDKFEDADEGADIRDIYFLDLNEIHQTCSVQDAA